MTSARTRKPGCRWRLLATIVAGTLPPASSGFAESFADRLGYDTAWSPERTVEWVQAADWQGATAGRWLRVRGMADSAVLTSQAEGAHRSDSAQLTPVRERREALQELHRRGFKIVALLRWETPTWISPTRPGAGQRAPLDLREVYARCQLLAQTYGDLIDIWEVDNEPDIFAVQDNPETFAAYFKTAALGLRSGRPTGSTSRIMLAPLALPPGPYWEAIVANGVMPYAEACNFHYYGFAEDLGGVADQWLHAFSVAARNGARVPLNRSLAPAGPRRPTPIGSWPDRANATARLPVFVTEYGYGLLDGAARLSTSGRARQRDWFEQVLPQLQSRAVAGTMAFVLRPYYERERNEFGLLASLSPPSGDNVSPDWLKPKDAGDPFILGDGSALAPTPALDTLLRAARRHDPAPLTLSPTPSALLPEVVLDLFVGPGTISAKSYDAHILTDGDVGSRRGAATLVLYNFSARVRRGVLTLEGPAGIDPSPASVAAERSLSIDLAPGERKLLPLHFVVPGQAFRRFPFQVTWHEARTPGSSAHASVAVLHTHVLPNAAELTPVRVQHFSHSLAEAGLTRDRLLRRPLASEEQRVEPQGRWLATPGVKVDEMPEYWSFEVTALPPQPLRPATVELPLPAGWKWPPRGMLWFQYRLAPTVAPPAVPRTEMLELFVRDAQGQLFGVWPPLSAGPEWSFYSETRENFTAWFFGRAPRRWSFRDAQPVSLVLMFKPRQLPAIYELTIPEIARWRVQ